MPDHAWMKNSSLMVCSTKDAPQIVLRPTLVVLLFRQHLVHPLLHPDLHDWAKAGAILR